MAKRDEKPKATEQAPPPAPAPQEPPPAAAETAAQEEGSPGPAEPSEEDAATAKADELALLGSLTPTQRALVAFQLEERQVLGSKEHVQEDGSVEVVLVTKGGQKLRWPRDEGRVLSAMEKGDAEPVPVPAGIFSK